MDGSAPWERSDFEATRCALGKETPQFESHGELMTLDLAGASFAVKLQLVHVASKANVRPVGGMDWAHAAW